MANPATLKPQAHVLTVEEQSKGGKNSVKARRERRKLKDCLEVILSAEYDVPEIGKVDGMFLVAWRVFEDARNGNMRAVEILRDCIDGKPASAVDMKLSTTSKTPKFFELTMQLLEDKLDIGENEAKEALGELSEALA